MTRDEQLRWLAEQIGEDWAWRKCQCQGPPWAGDDYCPLCSGTSHTGRVPAPLDQPELTLRLDDWAMRHSSWWGLMRWPFATETWGAFITSIIGGPLTAEDRARKLFDAVYAAAWGTSLLGQPQAVRPEDNA